ncbi:DUF6318 family protein [Arthrobacter sp. zg-Y786]|uniref:DUF6318 family protein n=2 Tax=Arthrobacter gengyunqii TaxID=2886940 RepID=A0A9X1S9K8_9MICC|nr:DUF6318 family protein [Arthrobacter gengyunqii]MCC3266737.1 DUF6318 family protein [Arthrobacter gengyunqii]MCC3269511.1 DUF6318 family protein [Arthrobacter gengyunqii]MCC3271004.1 DUF6318 family protein [Arthrobacter gengyunqii]
MSAAAVAAVLVLGGCSGSGEPEAEAAENRSSSASPSGSASASETATQTATPTPTPTAAYKPATAEGPAENVPLPVMPELAKEKSKEGLEAFAEYWYSLINYGYETGDPGPLRAASADTCFACESYYAVLDNGYSENEWMTGAKLHLQDLSSNYVETDEGAFQATILILQDDLQYYGPAGHLGTDPGTSTPAVQLMEAVFTSGGWYVVTLETLEM